MALYDSLFSMVKAQAAQVLVSASDFESPAFCANLERTVEELLRRDRVVPIFNENDAISYSSPVDLVRFSRGPPVSANAMHSL